MGRPATGWRTLASLERIRLPSPPAMTIAPRPVIGNCCIDSFNLIHRRNGSIAMNQNEANPVLIRWELPHPDGPLVLPHGIEDRAAAGVGRRGRPTPAASWPLPH